MTLQTDPVAADPTTTVALATAERTRSGRRVRLGVLRNRKALVGIVVLAFFVVLAIIGPFVAPYDPDTVNRDAGLQPPSGAHWLGTTGTGQDIFSQLLVGTQGVIFVGLIAGILATFISVVVGVVSGFVGGVGDEVLSLISNIFLVIPALPLIIIITGLLPSAGGLTVALVIAITGWAWGARVLRAQTLSLRRRDFVEAARANGEPLWRIVFFEIMPNLTAIIASGFIGTVIFAILSEVTLAFIGVTSISTWNWGTVLFWAQSSQALVQGAWWWFVPAGLCIAAVGTSLTLINFGIDEFVNPRLRSTAANAGVLRRKRIRARIGFTPVYRGGEALTPVRGTAARGSAAAVTAGSVSVAETPEARAADAVDRTAPVTGAGAVGSGASAGRLTTPVTASVDERENTR